MSLLQTNLERQILRSLKAQNRHPARDKFINSMARKSKRNMTVDEAHELALIVNNITWSTKYAH